MNAIMGKLRSRKGASMILAMVFMLFCLFVGGSVLAAASENGYRVEHLSDQQQYLDERSAALLICDQLRFDEETPLRLTILESESTIQPVVIQSGGVVVPYGTPHTETKVTVQGPVNLEMTPMQRLVLESAVWRYLEQSGTSAGSLTFSNFTYQGTAITSVDDFWYQHASIANPEASLTDVSGAIHIDGERTAGSSTIADFDAAFACGTGADLYDFTVDFGTADLGSANLESVDFDALTQMTVVLNGYSGQKAPITTKAVQTYGNGYAQITTVSKQTAISWEAPVIKKGGD